MFGQVRAISLRDSWISETGERTIYYQRIIKESETVDPTAFEPWEIEEMKKHDLSHEAILAKVQDLQKSVIQVAYDITTNPLPE